MAKKNKKVTEEPVKEQADTVSAQAEKASSETEQKTKGANDPATDGSVVLTAEEFKKAQEHIAKLQKDKDDTVALLQRNQADFDNYRRRNAQARTESHDEGKREVMTKLLPVLDNFERAFASETSDKAWRDGVELVFKQFNEELQKLGLSTVESEGKFDPNLHNAVMQEAVDGAESGQIIAVFQKGYRVNDRIIRHSMVKVAE